MATQSGLSLSNSGDSKNGVSQDRLADTFYPLYKWMFDQRGDFIDSVDTKLKQATRDTPSELFLSRATGYGTIIGVLLWLTITFMVWAVFNILGVEVGVIFGLGLPDSVIVDVLIAVKVPIIIVLTGIIFGAIGFAIGFLTPVMNLYLEAGSRKREITTLLPDVVAYMYALSVGGMNQLDILESTAKADDVYGEVAKEFEIILQEMNYFGVDYRTAIRNRSLETPSPAFGQFLTDMLSVLSAGGDMTGFLEDQKEKYIRTATKQQQEELDTLELFGEMFMTLSIFPILLLILLVVMKIMGNNTQTLMIGTVYGLIPMVGVVFIVMISTIKQDDPGDGYLIPEEGDPYIDSESSALGLGVVERFNAPYSVLDNIRDAEGTYQTKIILRRPHRFLLENPLYTLIITVPASMVLVAFAFINGIVPLSPEGWQSNVVGYTFLVIYLPAYIIAFPYAIAYEKKQRERNKVTKKLSDNLRKLASANDTGQTLLGSLKIVSQTSKGKLSDEFRIIHNKVKYDTSMKQALIEFNNKYHLPRLARTMKLIAKAQETSSQITPVLTTAAEQSEQADDLADERKTRARMQVAIIIMTYLTLLVVMAILKTQFLDTMAQLTQSSGGGGGGGGAGGGFNGINVGLLSLLFFHAVTLQALSSSMISGYMRTGKLKSGVKYLTVLPTIALIVWIFVG